MGQISDASGNIITRQGDTFYIDLTLEEDEAAKYGTLFVQIINSKRQPMLPQEAQLNIFPGDREVRIDISAELSDYLTVKNNEDYAEYYYAVKHCTASGIEDTWIIGGSNDLSELPTITVYPKVVNGGTGAPSYTYWTATSEGVSYRGKTNDLITTVFILEQPSSAAGNYPVSSIDANVLTITTEASIPTTYYKEGTEPTPEPGNENEEENQGE